MAFQHYSYDKKLDIPFSQAVKERVNEYFAERKLSKHADGKMVRKTILLFTLYLAPFIISLSGLTTNLWVLYGLWAIMGVATAGIGMGIMHDSIHGAYAQSPKINKLLGLTMNFIGGNAYVWHMQHNVLHHTYPNIDEVDDDLDIPFILRMSPHQPRHWFHKYQHIYVWVLYAFATVFWVTSKDFVMVTKYKERGLLKAKNEYFNRILNIVGWKIVYFSYLLVLPILLIEVPVYHIVLMFLLAHLIAGVLLSVIFQPAHVFVGSDFIKQESPKIERSWHNYQMQTTTNFKLNAFLKWLAGGLNYQIEHHLFPNICHIHYPKISHIVKATAKEYDMPYHLQGGLFGALSLHYDMLKTLGSRS